MRYVIRLTTVEVRDTAACPKCGARVGEECFDGATSRDLNHMDRRRAALKQHYELMDNALDAYREAVQR
jgi:hypothetical protein